MGVPAAEKKKKKKKKMSLFENDKKIGLPEEVLEHSQVCSP